MANPGGAGGVELLAADGTSSSPATALSQQARGILRRAAADGGGNTLGCSSLCKLLAEGEIAARLHTAAPALADAVTEFEVLHRLRLKFELVVSRLSNAMASDVVQVTGRLVSASQGFLPDPDHRTFEAELKALHTRQYLKREALFQLPDQVTAVHDSAARAELQGQRGRLLDDGHGVSAAGRTKIDTRRHSLWLRAPQQRLQAQPPILAKQRSPRKRCSVCAD